MTNDDLLFRHRLQLFARAQLIGVLRACREQQVIAFALGHPGLGPRRIAAQLALPSWGGERISANAVYKTLRRHGIGTRRRRLALVAGYAAPSEPERPLPPAWHIRASRV